MFSFDRFNLSRFSLGSQDNTIHIELLLAENLESVAGVAIPVETTAFFNDILRGTARGAIGIASAFESYAAMNSAALMRANIIVKGLLGDTLQAMSDGAQNSMIVNVLAENLGASSYVSADILWHEAYRPGCRRGCRRPYPGCGQFPLRRCRCEDCLTAWHETGRN